MFVDKVYQYAQQKFNGELGNLLISDVRIGVFLAGVKLSDGSYGVASVIHSNEIHQLEKKDRDFGAFTPLHITGKRVSELFEFPKNTTVVQILKIAVLNAYFHKFVMQNAYSIRRNSDPIDSLNLHQYKKVVMVGAFNSYIQKISKHEVSLQVLELNEEAFLPQHRQFYVPAEQYKEILPQADLVIMTGLTLVNNTFDDLLAAVSPKSTSVIIGPSASILPDLFFENHIDIIGGTLITEPEKLFPLVSQGAAGYHLFEYCAEKISILHA